MALKRISAQPRWQIIGSVLEFICFIDAHEGGIAHMAIVFADDLMTARPEILRLMEERPSSTQVRVYVDDKLVATLPNPILPQ